MQGDKAGEIVDTLRKIEKGANITHWEINRGLLEQLADQLIALAANDECRKHGWGRIGAGTIALNRVGWTHDYVKQECPQAKARIQASLYWMGTTEFYQDLRYKVGSWGVETGDLVRGPAQNNMKLVAIHTLFQHIRLLRMLQYSMMVTREGKVVIDKTRRGVRWASPQEGELIHDLRVRAQSKWVRHIAKSNWHYLGAIDIRSICRAAWTTTWTRWEGECDRRHRIQLQTIRAARVRLGRKIDEWRMQLEHIRTAAEKGAWFRITTNPLKHDQHVRFNPHRAGLYVEWQFRAAGEDRGQGNEENESPKWGTWLWLTKYLPCRICTRACIMQQGQMSRRAMQNYTGLTQYNQRIGEGQVCGLNHIWPLRPQLTWGGDIRDRM